MPETETAVVAGLSRLQILELQDELGEESIRPIDSQSDIRFGGLDSDTVLLIILTLPVVRAMARVIARDKTKILRRSYRPDGTVEETVIYLTKTPQDAAGEEDRIIKQLLGQSGDGEIEGANGGAGEA